MNAQNPIIEEQHSTVSVPGGSSLNVSGVVRRDSGAKVLNQIFVQCNVGRADKQGLVSLPLHVIPLERLMQRYYGGTVEPIPGFAAGLNHLVKRGMTKAQLSDELIRLRGNSNIERGPLQKGAYIHVKDNGDEQNLFHDVYGGLGGEKHRMFDCMAEGNKAWEAMLKKAIDENRRVTVDDIEEVIACFLPADELDGLEEIDAIPDAPVGAGMADPGLVEYLTEVGQVNDDVAQAFAQVVANAGSDRLSDDQWATVPGVGAHAMKRKALETKLKGYREAVESSKT